MSIGSMQMKVDAITRDKEQLEKTNTSLLSQKNELVQLQENLQKKIKQTSEMMTQYEEEL